ncbi:MAG TPA: carbon monoxide dehydrogenase subunit G [Geminicoccaceae bacterium]|nr:carbon monoxide dehydrogenase subunit G [Geminicoccaceae bacterium]
MDMSGEYRIPAPRQRVWEALNDPEILKASIPGCEELNRLSDRDLEAKVRAKVGPVSATFNGKVTLSDLNPPESYRIAGEGKGGAAGFAKGGADVALTEDGADTILRYNAKADVGGKLAQIGSRLIQGTARKMADDFFGRFSAIVGDRFAAEHAAAAPPAPGTAAPSPAAEAAPPRAAEAAPPPPRLPAREELRPAPSVETPVSRGETSPAAAGMSAAAAGTPMPEPSAPPPPSPQPRQVAFQPERPVAERPATVTPPARTGAGQPWWVWLGAAIVVVILLFWLLT